ncbi:PP2C family serine/threonine-protein phosphatase [Paratractidigestivibacter sp.]|uniref:PP2C family protein-serine/threonine phosphatase n=1 Tax=Paratractidigestivibacter sp. TaxID=2847316 RepID=UPI002AC90055|nr:PP2C family serine/threonine-protein phosphatase [Paratractidigestivibacter sp.]
MVEVVGRTYIGTGKGVNQDAYAGIAARASFGDAALAVVCDGVGGLSCGEVASSAAVRELVRWFDAEFPAYAADNLFGGHVDLGGIEAAWTAILADLNRRMRAYGQRLNVRMGSTCTAILLCSGSFVVCHVGDCRAYRAGAAGVERLTRDQTFIQREVDAGRISARDALTFPGGTVITQAVGAQETLAPIFSRGSYVPGDVLFVCCDGLYRRLGDDRVALGLAGARRSAGEDELLDALDSMVARAVDAGETDNVTGVIARVCGPGEGFLPLEPASAAALDDGLVARPATGFAVTAAPLPKATFAADEEATDDLACSVVP